MMHSFPAPRTRRPVLLTLVAAFLALLFVAFIPGIARAECRDPVPDSRFYGDGGDPNAPDAQAGAPEISFVHAELKANCELIVDPRVSFTAGQSLVILLALDPTTGNPATETYDLEIWMEPGFTPAAQDPFGGFVVEVTPYGGGGFIAHVNDLGIPPGTNLGIGVIAYGPNGETDYAPNIDQLFYRLPIDYTEPPPPPLPPPPPPPPPVASAPPAANQVAGCIVPKLKGLTVKKAKAALKKAACKYKLKGKGRVRSYSPKAGTRTAGTVQVKCKQKRRKKKRSRRA